MVKQNHPFHIDAWVLLPDHMHCTWTLPKNDADISKRWGLIKAGFSKQVRDSLHREALMTPSKRKHRESRALGTGHAGALGGLWALGTVHANQLQLK